MIAMFSDAGEWVARQQMMPYYTEALKLNLMDILGAALFPFALCFLIPVFMNT